MDPRGSKGPTHVELKHLSTYGPEMKSILGSTVLPGMNCVVLYGEKDKSKGLQIYLLKIEKEKCTSVTNFKSMCNHDERLRLTPLEISGQEHLVATCEGCKQIFLCPLTTKKWSVAFEDK